MHLGDPHRGGWGVVVGFIWAKTEHCPQVCSDSSTTRWLSSVHCGRRPRPDERKSLPGGSSGPRTLMPSHWAPADPHGLCSWLHSGGLKLNMHWNCPAWPKAEHTLKLSWGQEVTKHHKYSKKGRNQLLTLSLAPLAQKTDISVLHLFSTYLASSLTREWWRLGPTWPS